MNNRRTILLTGIWLADVAGAEAADRDVALGLLRRGHRPIVYAPKLGGIADDIAARGVPVIDDLRKLAERPDIIHAQHAIPCGEALIRFPDVPAVQVCHTFDRWTETPAHFPQIGAYVAADEACRDRLIQDGVDPGRVVVLPNAERARHGADLEQLLDDFERLYAEVLDGARRPSMAKDAHARAVARFLHEYLPRRPEMLKRDLEARGVDARLALSKMTHEREELRRQLEARQLDARDRIAQLEYERDGLRHDLNLAAEQLAGLRRSHLLRIGRLLRRIVGLPSAY